MQLWNSLTLMIFDFISYLSFYDCGRSYKVLHRYSKQFLRFLVNPLTCPTINRSLTSSEHTFLSTIMYRISISFTRCDIQKRWDRFTWTINHHMTAHPKIPPYLIHESVTIHHSRLEDTMISIRTPSLSNSYLNLSIIAVNWHFGKNIRCRPRSAQNILILLCFF